MSLELQTIEVRGIPTRYLYRPGPAGVRPIVFIPGFGMSVECWSDQIEHFSKTHPVVSYNWRGMGGTGGTGSEYLVNDLSTDLFELLRLLKVEQPVLCGHSLGGMIAISYAVTYVDSYAALILVDTSLTSWKQAFSGALGFGMLGITRFFAKLFHTPEKEVLAKMAPQFIQGAYTPAFLKAHPEFYARTLATFIAGNTLRGIDLAFMGMATRQPVAPAMHCIAEPAMLVWGKLDTVFTQADMERIRAAFVTDWWTEPSPHPLPKLPPPLEEIPDAGHCCFQEQPAIFNALVEKFLAAHAFGPNRVGPPP